MIKKQILKPNLAVFQLKVSDSWQILAEELAIVQTLKGLRQRTIGIPEKEKQKVLSNWLLLQALKEEFSLEPTEIEFGTTWGGKPFLLSHPKIKFNNSHSGNIVVVAISSDKEVGVDIEMVREKPVLDISSRIFHHNEADLLKSLSKNEQKELFFKFWTLKESYMKTYDLRLRYALRNMDFSAIKREESEWNNNDTNFHSYKIAESDLLTTSGYWLAICQNR